MFRLASVLPLLAAAALFRDCNPNANSPDFIPVNPPGIAPQFCDLDRSAQQNKLRVTVKNQGNAAGAADVIVNFRGTPTLPQSTGQLAPGASTTLLFAIPTNCFSPDCSFSITVDPNNTVKESNETNNTVSGACVG